MQFSSGQDYFSLWCDLPGDSDLRKTKLCSRTKLNSTEKFDSHEESIFIM